ncbi:MAG: hypothetical protein HY820_36675 [Acidobacteria bacterium]|nr:hypothetical protein [Acidobacteriota bacterium]
MNQITNRIVCAAAALMVGGVVSAYGQATNVSKIATGTQSSYTVIQDLSAPEINISASLKYFPMTSARISNEATGYFDPGPWSAAWQNSPTSPTVTRLAPTAPVTKFGIQYLYASSNFRSALANLNVAPENTSSMAFGTGAAESVSTQSIRLEAPGQTLDYFVEFSNPAMSRSVVSAYNLVPGSNGGTYVYSKPKDTQSRVSVTVLVDGLPVWSSDSSMRYATANAQYAWDKTESYWGKTATGSGTTRLYLGRISSASLVVTLVVRSAAKVEVNSCPQDSPGSFESTGTIRCHQVTETVKMANLPGKNSSIRVYAKNMLAIILL